MEKKDFLNLLKQCLKDGDLKIKVKIKSNKETGNDVKLQITIGDEVVSDEVTYFVINN